MVAFALLTPVTLLTACGGGATTPASPSLAPSAAPAATEVEPLKGAAAPARLVGTAVQARLLRTEPAYAAAAAHHFNYVTAEFEMKWGQIERQPGNGTTGRRTRSRPSPRPAACASRATPSSGTATRRPGSSRSRLPRSHRARGPHPHHGRPLPRPHRRLGRRERGDRGRPARAARHRLPAQARPGLHRRGVPAGPRGRPRRAAHLQRLRRRGLEPEVGRRLRPRPRPAARKACRSAASACRCTSTRASRPATADIARNIRRLAELGLLVNISEMDVRVARVGGDSAARARRAAPCLPRRDRGLRGRAALPRVTFWGFTDRHSWIDAFFGPDDPLLFDESYRAKPAYFGALDALRGR